VLYQNIFRTYNQRAENYPASRNPPLMERPNSNSNRVDSLVYSDRNLLGTPSLDGNSSSKFPHTSQYAISQPLGMSRTTDSRGHSSIQTQTMLKRGYQFLLRST